MARIIIEGKLPELDEFQLTCSNCGTVAIYQRNELVWDGDQREQYVRFTCPFCSKSVTHDSWNIDKFKVQHTPRPEPPKGGGLHSMISRQWDQGGQFKDK